MIIICDVDIRYRSWPNRDQERICQEWDVVYRLVLWDFWELVINSFTNLLPLCLQGPATLKPHPGTHHWPSRRAIPLSAILQPCRGTASHLLYAHKYRQKYFCIRIKILAHFTQYDEHIARRSTGRPRTPAYRDWRIEFCDSRLPWRSLGNQPTMQPQGGDRRFRGDVVFDERVLFTFLMNSKGSLIGGKYTYIGGSLLKKYLVVASFWGNKFTV
jgi:hypothetical protein